MTETPDFVEPTAVDEEVQPAAVAEAEAGTAEAVADDANDERQY